MASEEYKRGQRIISADQALQRAERLLPLDDFGLTWGGVVLPSSEANTHFCVVGATGSGKTTLLRLLMQSCLPLIGAEYKEKSYHLDQSEVVPPTQQEWDSYNAAMQQYKTRVAERDTALKKNQDLIDAVQKLNQEIKIKNEATSQEIAPLDEKLAELLYAEKSIVGLVLCLLASFVMLPFCPFIFDQSETPYYLSLPSMVLLPTCLIVFTVKIIKRRKENYKIFKQWRLLNNKREHLALLEEKAVPARLELPAIPPLLLDPPRAKTTPNVKAVPAKPHYGDGHRAMIYDAKGDVVSLLMGMQLSCPVEILNPFDARATAWDIAKDVTTPVAARQFATILIPEDKNASQPFFSNSARDLIAQAILALIQLKPGAWTLRDLLLSLQSAETITSILSQTPLGKIKIKTYFDEERTGNNILSEIATRMSPFESVAQAWSHCARKISLDEWIKSESILVLGTSEEHRAALDPINRVLFQRATELTLAQSESVTRRTWFYLDEVRDAGNLESLGRLMTKGRSKGASVVLGFQDIEGMHDAFGKERANEFIGQCANKAILRLGSPETAKWASELFGKYEFIEEESGENKGGSKTTGVTETKGLTEGDTKTTGSSEGSTTGTTTGTSRTFGTSSGFTNNFGGTGNSSQTGKQDSEQTSEQKSDQKSNQTSESVAVQKSTQSSTADNKSDTESWTTTINKKRMEKDALLPSEFMTLPPTNPRNGLHGYYLLPSIGAFQGVLDSAYIKGSLLPPDLRQPNYVPRDASEQYLQMWTEPERIELGLTQAPSGGATASTPPANASSTPSSPTAPPLQVGPVPQASPANVARLQALMNKRTR